MEIRCDDVLQSTNFSKDQQKRFIRKMPFLYFMESDRIFKEYNFPCTLAVLSEGIDDCRDWVEYIKRNLHRYKIELHGSSHIWYRKMSEEEGYEDLKKAKEKIEGAFEIKITTWYIPFGRENIPTWGEKVCQRLGIKCDIPTMKQLPYYWNREPKREQINFHYWCEPQCRQIKSIIQTICEKLQS